MTSFALRVPDHIMEQAKMAAAEDKVRTENEARPRCTRQRRRGSGDSGQGAGCRARPGR